MEKKEKEVAEEYLSSLADLNLNSKPLINMLTILAEENIEFALVIVKAVEQHIAKVNPDVKLPVLYLIDSIVKNVGREYIQLFSHSIVNIFCGVFDKVNEKIREKMYTLRQTWNDVFTPQKLYTLDVKVNCLDPNWPITAKVVPKSPAIHVNPNFLKNKNEPLNEMMEAKLAVKQRQLLELQKRKLELELAATKQRLEEQEKQLQTTIQTDTTKPAVTAAGPVPASVPGKTNNTHYSKGQSKSSNAGNTTASFPPANSNAPKIRVAPVNPALLNSIRQRDPRLARQQQQQQQAATVPAQQLNSSESRDSTVPSNRLDATTNQSPSSEVQHSDNKTVTESNSEKTLAKISPKSNYGNRDRSNRVGSSSYSASSKRSQSRGSFEKIGTSDEKKSPPTSSIQTSNNRVKSSSSSSSSSRVTSSSKSGILRDGPKSSSRDKSSSSSYERKRSGKTDSPGKSEKLAALKQNEKSPKRYFDGSLKMPTSSRSNSDTVPSSPTKFKDIKQGIKARNYMRRNQEKSRSTSPQPPEVPSSSSQDVDLRSTTTYPSPKRSKQPDTVTMPAAINNNAAISTAVAASAAPTTTSVSDTKQTMAPVASSNNMTEKLEQNLEAVSCMDVDLRQFHGNAMGGTSSTPGTVPEAVGAAIAKVSLDTSESKKRSITPTETVEEPASKKNKSEKIDTLFGTEDVDLRTLASSVAISSSGMPSTPPPPPIISNESENWAKVKGSKQSKMVSKSNLDDVRAKLAKAAKGDKYEKDSKDIKKSSRFVETQEDSEDGTDTNIRTIISQAQEMLESENMDVEQYNTLVKTVIQINETNKLKEAQRRESLLTKDSTNLEDLTPISDEEEKFTSEDEDDVTGMKSSKLKVLAKRIPKVAKKTDDEATGEKKFEQSSVLKRSPTPTNGSSYADSRPPPPPSQNTSKPEKRTRQKESKWSPWEPSAAASIGKPKWVVGNNNFRPTFPLKGINVPNPPTLINRASIPSPWQNPPQMIFASAPTQTPLPPIPPSVMNPMLPLEATSTPGPPVPPILLSSHLSNSVDNPNSDLMRTINIDGVPKEIRFYDEVAIAFMEWDQPKEIGFQLGQRRILVDDHDVVTLNFNDTYKTIMIDGTPHQIRFGCPTRELYIDNDWYECYFGEPPIGIFIDGRVRVFKVEGPAPQVRIGNMRQDLVVGKINLILDALIIIPVFLDGKVQKFEVDDTIHTLQFADYLKTVLIDNVPFDVEYGGLPKSLFLNGVKHFVRFGTLPNGVVPGKVIVQNMIRTEKFKAELPLVSPETNIQGTLSSQFDSQQAAGNTIAADVLASTVQNNDVKPDIKPDGLAAATVGNLNIDDLFQKLLASGILNQNQPVAKNDESKKDKTKEKPITPIDMSRPETIKARQSGIIQKLFCGMQCSSCGVRFPPEQTMKYSQHLDWHFRQNRKERDNSRRAHSRKWYYEVTDWIQYEEIEDLEEREKNWFESQLNEMENVDENSNQRTNSPPPSCPAGPDDVDKACDMCHDKFEQFYNEESEEWHLRGAIRVEEKLYHPPCYEDYKASLTFDETLATSMDTDDNALDSAIIKTEKEADDLATEVIDDDEDDVIVVPAEEPSIQEIPDDDDDEIVIEDKSLDNEILVPDSETSDSLKKTDATLASEPMESDDVDVEIQEPHIPFTDLDTYEEVPANSISTVDDSSQSSQFNAVKIKEEPKDDGYNDDDAFEEVGTIICDDDITTQPIDDITPHVATAVGHDATQITSIDGNVDNQDTPAQTVGVNKIKINIINTSSLRNEHTFPITTIGGCGGRNDHANSPSATEENSSQQNETTAANSAVDNDEYTDSIQYTLKAELEKVKLKKVPRRTSGLETSGLCSIM